jgi:hypothetical protein
MTIKLILGAAFIATVATTTGVLATHESAGLEAPLPVPAESAVELPVNLVYARAFELATPATHWWRAEQPSYTKGLLVVLEANPNWLAPRQTAEPIIFVGGQTIERINTGYPSGQLVGIVPNMTLAELAEAPIFFGQPGVPEEVDAAHIAIELDAAIASGLQGPGKARVNLASAHDSTLLSTTDQRDLYTHSADLIETYSPDETSVIEGFRVIRGN